MPGTTPARSQFEARLRLPAALADRLTARCLIGESEYNVVISDLSAAGCSVTGMAAGMATVAVVQRRTARKAAKRRRKVLSNVVASRSFLVDVHVLGDR